MAVLTDITRALPDEQVHTRLASLTIQDFRNYDGCRLEIDAPKVLLLGENGSGKTNLMEAVSFLHRVAACDGQRPSICRARPPGVLTGPSRRG